MAQQTLMTVWSREDYQFEKEEDFLKVCYGFARKILLEGYRVNREHAAEDPDVVESRVQAIQGLRGNEVSVFLEEVCRRAATELQEEEWAMIQAAVQRIRIEIAVGAFPHAPWEMQIERQRWTDKLGHGSGK